MDFIKKNFFVNLHNIFTNLVFIFIYFQDNSRKCEHFNWKASYAMGHEYLIPWTNYENWSDFIKWSFGVCNGS